MQIGRYLFFQKEIKMYNDRIRQLDANDIRGGSSAPRCRINQATNNLRSDIPDNEIYNRNEGRRSCNGSLRNGMAGNSRAEQSEISQYPCACMSGWGLKDHPLAMVYSPCQPWANVYTPDVALGRGTMFSELDLPFEIGNGKRGCM